MRISLLPLVLVAFSASVGRAELVHRYSFNDGDLNAFDSVGGQHGTLEGGATIISNGVLLDGDGDYVNLPSDLITGFTSVTFEFWFIYIYNGSWTRVFDFGDTNPSGAGRYYIFYTTQSDAGTSRLVISDADPGNNHEEIVNYSIPVMTVPVHVACVYDGVNDTMSLYVDGELADSISVTIPLSSVDNARSYLGRSLYNGDPYLLAFIDEFRIYNSALDSGEIYVNYILGPDAAHAAYVATNPNPANNSTGVQSSIQLGWTPPINIPDSYTVYVSDDPNFIGGQIIEVPDGNSCTPVLDSDITYYWRVDTHYGPTTYSGVVWTFITCAPPLDRSPVGDINGDYEVDFLDLQWMANDWLADENSPANLIDLGSSEGIGVDNADYAQFANNWLGTAPKLVINEFMADNKDYLQDSNSDCDDWLEIYNCSNATVDLSGMYLTDNLDNPDKWRIPDGVTIAPQGYLLFWADEQETQGNNHTNFKLDSAGEEIGLFDTDGSTLIDSVDFDDQYPNLSYGRHPDAGPLWRFFDVPTPLACNCQGYLGAVANPEFSADGGFYSDPSGFDVYINCDTPDATIYYTTDFTEPTESSQEYTGPIHVDPTTCLRAIAFKPGWLPSRVVSRTYISLDDVSEQPAYPPGFPTYWGQLYVDYAVDPDVVDNPAYSATFKNDLQTIPSVCIVIPNDDFFGTVSGIYANASQRGLAWEREASIEFVDPCSGEYFQVNAGLRAHGGYARTTSVPKQSLRMLFKSKYGPSKLEFPLFKDSDIEVFDQLVLRATWNYSWTGDSTACGGLGTDNAQYMRELYTHDTIRDMDRLQGFGRHVHLYINGLYWGLYILTERPDDGFAEEHLGGDKSDYDVIKTDAQYWTGANVIELLAGDRQAWDKMFALAEADLSTPEDYAAIQEYLDIPALIDYMLMIFHVGSRDAPVLLCNDTAPRNFYAIRKREPGGTYVFIPWDVEWSLENTWVDRVNVGSYINSYENPAYLFVRLKANEEFRFLVADHIHKHFFNNGQLTEQKTIDRYWTRIMDIDRAIVGESARWGDVRRSTPYTRNVEWITERNRLINDYFPVRRDIVLSQLQTAGLYPNVDAPVFYINGLYQHGGQVSTGASLSMTNPNGSGTIYYTLDGNDVRLPTKITGAAENADKRVLVPSSDIGSTWRTDTYFDDSAWDLCTGSPGGVGYEADSGYQGLISLDVKADMFGPGRNTTCYVRIPFTIDADDMAGFDLMTLKVRYDDAFVAYLNGTEVARRNYTGTPQWHSSADNDDHEASTVEWDEIIDISAYLGDLEVGDNLLAIHAMNYSSISRDFLICAELAAGASDTDSSISPDAIEYTGPITLNESTHVKARVLDDGTWSALNEAIYAVGQVVDNLRITEIMYHPQDTNDPNDPNEEFIELKNIGQESLNLNLVRFTEGINFTFPSLPLDPCEYVLVVKDYNAIEARYASDPNFNLGKIAGEYAGSLNNGGEKIRLEDAIGQIIHDFRYRDGWFDITDGGGFSLTIRNADSNDPNDWGSKSGWRTSAYIGGSPGWDDSGEMPDRGTIVFNELLANSQGGPFDWIELYNTTGETINIGGWFLSDNDSNLMKYEIAEGTTIGPYDYIVFYENLNFGNPNNPGCHIPFALSGNGEAVYLHAGRNGQLMGEMDVEEFDASEVDVAFGRYQKSTGTYNFVAMSANTPWLPNAYPKIGPIVINEIMYHPDPNVADRDAEYVELLNISGSPVTLQEYDNEQHVYVPWRFTDSGGISFDFPLNTTMESGEYLLLVKDIDDFNDAGYPAVPGGVQIFEWDDGKLDNGGEKIQLSKPGDEDPVTHERYYIRVDRVNYSDGSHHENFDYLDPPLDPWPPEPDGRGASLGRLFPHYYGNDPNNWQAITPTPGL